HLVDRLLTERMTVRVLLRQSRRGRWPADDVETAYGDIRDPVAMRSAVTGVDIVFHLAASVHRIDDANDTADHFAVNVGGTRTVLKEAVDARVQRFVFISSVKAMGEETRGCANELDGVAPTTAYGESKLEAEQLVLETGKHNGLHVVCLRLPMVYGPGHKGNLVRMIAA